MANTTIYDVSERAGVSITTVSRVLNSPDQVSPQTRARVLAAIDELDFEPKFNALVRARKSVGRIGVLTPHFTSDSFIDRLRGIAAALVDSPYELVIYNVASVGQRDAYLSKLPLTHRVDGLIVIDLPFNETTAHRLLKHQLATVLIVSLTDSISCSISSIVHDDAAGSRMAAEYLLGRGHRCFGYVGESNGLTFSIYGREQKLDPFRQTLALSGVPLPDSYVSLVPFGMEHARQGAHRLLDLPEPPTAIFAGSDTQAIGVISAARERGLAVPGELAVMGFDDIEVAEFMGLTTIRQQLKESGRLAVEMLVAQLSGNPRPPQQVPMTYTLMQRATA
ncbi:MAG: LacI family transcriptional regulator [Chloroflexota bacterium]|nr:LacI family transcriptional regulator [Chloroflexota bacterium]